MAKPKKENSAAQPALSLVTDRYNRARDYRITTQDEVWKRSYRNWRGELDATIYPWRSKLFIPWSFTVIETIIPRIFARDPKWRAISRNPDFDPDSPQVVSDLLTYQWRQMGMRIKMYDYIKDSLMYAKGFAKVSWNFQTKTKTIMEPVVGKDDEITFKKVVKSDVENDDPLIDIIDPADIYVDPDATSAGYGGDGKYIIHRKTVDIKELEQNPNYKNVDQIHSAEYADQYADKLMRYQDNIPQRDKHDNLVEILEYWEEDRLVVVANRSVVLRDSPNPYNHKQIPFVELDDYRDPHRLYGQSELSVIDPLQREINSIRNQRRDYDNLALNPVIQMVPGTLRNPNSAVMAPGSVWMVSDLNSIGTFQMPQLQGTATDIENQTAGDIKMATAIDEIGIGLLPDNPQRRSATEVVTSQQSAGKRFSMKIALLEDAVQKMGELIYALNQQFLDKERMIQVVGEDGANNWVRLSPADVRGQFYIEIETGSMLPRDEIAQRQEAVQLLQYISPLVAPVIQSNPAVIMPIIRMVLETFELPGKAKVMEDLKAALEGPQRMAQEQQMADVAATEANALSSVQDATMQGARADLAVPQNAAETEMNADLAATMG